MKVESSAIFSQTGTTEGEVQEKYASGDLFEAGALVQFGSTSQMITEFNAWMILFYITNQERL
jgi:hypothetical protein